MKHNSAFKNMSVYLSMYKEERVERKKYIVDKQVGKKTE